MTGIVPGPRFIDPAQIDEVLRLMKGVAGEKGVSFALVGGVAMQAYGSDRLTLDVDFVGSETLGPQKVFEIVRPLTFGGLSYKAPNGVGVDLIVRNDAYRALYEEALRNATSTPDGTPVVRAEYLAVLKFVSARDKDLLDLSYLLTAPSVLDREKAKDIVFRLLGGQFAVDVWNKTADQLIWKARREKGEP